MKLAVLGAGLQARAVVDDWIRFSGAETIGVADVDEGRAVALAETAGSERVVPRGLDVEDEAAVVEWMRGFDAVLSAVPYRYNLWLTRCALQAPVHFTDLGGSSVLVDRQLEHDGDARAAGVLVIPDLGIAPGLTGLLGAELVRRLEPPRRLHLRVGGLPARRCRPLDYRLTFAVTGLINEYIEPCRVLRGGKLLEVPGLSELESLEFPEPFGNLEAFQTSGGTSTLVNTLEGEVEELDYKTIRYPGHHAHVQVLHELGLFDSRPREIEGASVTPRALTEHLLEEALGETVPDVLLWRVTAHGTERGRPVTLREEMIVHADPHRGLSAMAQCTGFPAAIITALVAGGSVTARGVKPQEQVIDANVVRAELARRGFELTLTKS